MLWQEKGNKFELKPTSGQKSFCSSQLGPRRRRSPTLGSPPQACGAAQLHPGTGHPSRPQMTARNPPFPPKPDEPELPEADPRLCLRSPQSKPGGLGETQTHVSSKKPDCGATSLPQKFFWLVFQASCSAGHQPPPWGSPAMFPGVMGATVPPGPGTTPPATASEPSRTTIPIPQPAPEQLGVLLCASVSLAFLGATGFPSQTSEVSVVCPLLNTRLLSSCLPRFASLAQSSPQPWK